MWRIGVDIKLTYFKNVIWGKSNLDSTWVKIKFNKEYLYLITNF